MRHVAFLRGLNVGTAHRVKMDRLRELFAAAGCTGVATLQAAGNVLFDGPGPGEAALEAVLRDGLGYEVPTFVRSADELAAVASSPPFPGLVPERPAALHVVFLREAPPADVATAVAAASTDVDTLRIHGRELYWLAGAGLTGSTVEWKALAPVLPDTGTNRNMTTVRKLAAMAAA